MRTSSNRTIRRTMAAVAAAGAVAAAAAGGYALAGTDGPAGDTRVAMVAAQEQQGHGAPG